MTELSQSAEIIRHVSALSYAGIFGLSLLANVVIPVPEEISLLAIGYVIGTGKIDPFITTAIVIAGLLVSDFIVFILARQGNKILTFIYNKFFSRTLARDPEFVKKHIEKFIFFSRFLVQLRFLGPFLAGKEKTSLRTFFTYELAALFIYVPGLLLLGDYFRDRFEAIVGGLGAFRNIILIIVGIFLLISFMSLIRQFFLGTYLVSFRSKEEYERTWIPGLLRRKDIK
jgi:membrane protein DedA with SNARE-associated domain